MVVSLYSKKTSSMSAFLSNYAVINLQNPLARLPGVGQIRVVGAGPYSMRVWLDPNKLQNYRSDPPWTSSTPSGAKNVQVVAATTWRARRTLAASLSIHRQRLGSA